MTGVELDLRSLAAEGPVHFMGMGGAGMCALAELLSRHGGSVSGCDTKENRSLNDLARLGVTVSIGHDAEHVEDASALVVTAAVPSDHPELLRAYERGIPVLKRAQALGAIVNRGLVVAIAGTHGKTTTTAMTTQVLAAGGLNPTGFVGGRVHGWDGNLRFGSDALFVVEADEYDRSFHTLTPDVAVVTNLEADHLEIYGDLRGVREGFLTFLAGVRGGGRIIACADDHGASSLLPHVGTAGLAPFEPRLLMDWRVDEYLAWSGRLLGVPKRRAAERAAATLERLHIAGHRRRELRLLTRAERRAIVIAAAVVHEPDVVICDMPLSRLDTPEQGFVLATLQRARAGRRSIVSLDRLALHGAVAEVLRSASDVVVLKDGRLLLHTSPAELFVGVGIFEMSVAAGGAELAAALRERGIQSDGGPLHFLVRLPETCQPRDVLAEAARVGSAVTALVPLIG